MADIKKFLDQAGVSTWWSRITTELENKVNVLIGTDNNKSVRAIAAEEVATIVAGADESYDTLKEISDWIKGHPNNVGEINSEITTIKELIGYSERIEENESGE